MTLMGYALILENKNQEASGNPVGDRVVFFFFGWGDVLSQNKRKGKEDVSRLVFQKQGFIFFQNVTRLPE